jgi:hypothetical protein
LFASSRKHVEAIRLRPEELRSPASLLYDAYIGGVYRLLASGSGCEQIAGHLAALERDCLGHPQANAERNLAAARKLCDLDVRL